MLLDELQSLLDQYGLSAKKHLGQNFLVDEKVYEAILDSAELKKEDTVVEVGPGTGFLTERLLEEVKKVISVEKDSDMVRILNERFGNIENFELEHSDILKCNLNEYDLKPKGYKLVANIPYYITSPILKLFLQSDVPPSLIVLLVQREVAEKVCGFSGKSLITIETQLFGKPEIIGTVDPHSFYPAPKVQSAVLKVEVLDQPQVSGEELKDFLRLVKFGFSQKRKKLPNALKAGLKMDTVEVRELLKKAGIDPEGRAEDLDIEGWKRLHKLTKHI